MEENKLKKVNSPEQLDQYIKLSNPGVWFVLVAIIILLVGVCIWGMFGQIDTKVKSVVITENYVSNCYIKEDDISKVQNGMKIEVNNNTYSISSIDNTPIKIDDSFSEYAIKLGGYSKDEWVYKCKLNSTLPSGVYSGEIIVESISPSKFILN